MNDIVKTDVALPAIKSGGAIAPIVPQNFEDAFRIANAVVIAGMAPSGLGTPEKCMVAIMSGLEVGMPPMMALQSIAVINNRPCIWGDGALGLVLGSGLVEWKKEYFEGEDDDFKAVMKIKRKGDPEIVTGEFSIADAKRANLWEKSGTPWVTYWKRMLQMRARGFTLRDGFADVLKGLRIREEVEDYQETSEAPPPVPEELESERVEEAPPPVPEEPAKEEAESYVEDLSEDPVDPREYLDELGARMEAITALSDLDDLWAEAEAHPALQYDDIKADAKELYEAHASLIKPAEAQDTGEEPVQESAEKPETIEDPDAFIDDLIGKVKAAENIDALMKIWSEEYEPNQTKLFPPDRDKVTAAFTAAKGRLGVE